MLMLLCYYAEEETAGCFANCILVFVCVLFCFLVSLFFAAYDWLSHNAMLLILSSLATISIEKCFVWDLQLVIICFTVETFSSLYVNIINIFFISL